MGAKDLAVWVQYLGIAVAMGGGAPWPKPNWLVVIAGLVIVAVGIVWKRAVDKREGHVAEGHGEGVPVAREGSVQAARAALPAMVTKARELATKLESAPLGEIATEIDALQQNGTEQVAASQEALVRAYSFAAYATVMTPLSMGERWLYRAWSAASDGHRPEVIASVKTAVPYLEAAQEALEGLK